VGVAGRRPQLVAGKELTIAPAQALVNRVRFPTLTLLIFIVMQRFIDIIQKDKKVFIGHLDEDNYIEIQYVGWNQKGVNSYKIQIWRDECGCIYEQIKRFPNMNQAILCAVSNAT
jgi:hypothetical protein